MRTWLLLALASRAAWAQPSNTPPVDGGADYTKPAVSSHDTVLHVQNPRSAKNIAILASVAGAGAVFGAIGVAYNLDSKSAADQVSAHRATGMAWSPALQATYDRAHDAGVKAGVFYGIGGALIVGAIVGLIVTEPKTETIIVHPRGAALSWSF